MPITIQWRFNYYHQRDIIECIINLNGNVFSLGLPYEKFMVLMGELIKTAAPFFKDIAEQRAKGIKEDLHVLFDQSKWEKMMEDKNA